MLKANVAHRRISLPLALAAACWAFLANAEDAAAPVEKEAPVEEEAQVIVVTATRTETPLWQTGSAVDVVDAGDLADTSAEPLAGALEALAGLSFSCLGTPGQQTTLFTRGADGKHTLVIIDGVRINDQDAYVDWGTLNNFGIGRIEMLRGAGSSMYGTDAMAGVVNVETARGHGPPGLSFSVAGTSEQGYMYEAAASGEQALVGYNFGVGSYYYGGPDYPNSDYRATSAYIRIDAAVTTDSALKCTVRRAETEAGWYTNNSRGMGPSVGGIWLDPNDRISTDSTLASVAWDKQYGLDNALSLSAGTNVSHRRYVSTAPNDTSVPEGTQDYLLTRHSASIKLANAFAADRKVVYGADVEHTGFDKIDTQYKDTRSHTRDGGGFYAQYQQVVRENLAGTFGTRVEYDSIYGAFVSWRWTAAYRTGGEENLLLRASAGQAFRAPTFLELYSSWGGNPNLEPEENLGFDIGAEYALSGPGIRLAATFFNNDFTNLIKWNVGSGFQNTAEALSQGVEAAVRQERTDLPVYWNATYTYLHTEAGGGGILERRPRYRITSSIGWRPGDRLRLEFSVLTVGPWEDILVNPDWTTTRVDMGGYTRLDALLAWKADENIELFFRAENLADVYYEPAYSFPAPGFNWSLGAKVSLNF